MKENIKIKIGRAFDIVVIIFIVVPSLCVVFFLIFFLIVLSISDNIDNKKLPENYFKKTIEFRIKDTLPSLQVIEHSYYKGSHARAVIKLSEEDFLKVLVTADETFKPLGAIFSSPRSAESDTIFVLRDGKEYVFFEEDAIYSRVRYWPDDYEEILKLMKKANISPNDVIFKYEVYRERLGFVPPNIIIYDAYLYGL